MPFHCATPCQHYATHSGNGLRVERPTRLALTVAVWWRTQPGQTGGVAAALEAVAQRGLREGVREPQGEARREAGERRSRFPPDLGYRGMRGAKLLNGFIKSQTKLLWN
jgi:hypothetical protein